MTSTERSSRPLVCTAVLICCLRITAALTSARRPGATIAKIAHVFKIFSCNLLLDENWWKLKQGALLPQMDRATRCVSQNLVNFRNKLCNKSTTNRSSLMELEGYSWPTCSKQPRFVDCRVDVNKLDRRRRRRRRVSLTPRSTCHGKIFYVRVWDKVPDGSTLYDTIRHEMLF